MNATILQFPKSPADGVLCMFRRDDGQLLKTWTQEDSAKLVQHARARAEFEEFDHAALRSLRTALRSLARIEDHEITFDHVASAAAHFGDEAGLPILFEYVESVGTPECDVDYIVSDLWCEACERRGDTFANWEKASHEEGGWRWLVRRVRELEGGEPPTPGASAPASTPGAGDVLLVCASDVKLKKYDWLWNSYLVRGKFHVVAGAPSGGKTTLMLKLCAIASSGGTWPDGEQAKVGKVLIWSSEDDFNDTLAPRLKAMGANLSNVHFIEGVVDAITVKRRSFDPSTDMPALQRAVQRIGDVSLILIDPVVSFVTGDSHKNAEVRRGLQPLVDLAQECGAALIGISHFTKGTSGRDPVERVTGSLAFGALARVVFAVAKRVDEESNETERIFVRAKSNIGPSDGGFKFTIDQVRLPAPDDMDATAVTWGEPLEGTARDLLKEAEGAGESSSKTEDAAELIQETIRTKGGAASATDLHAALKAAGIGKHNRYRAIDKLLVEQHRIERVRYVENGPWTYIFPRRGGVADVSAFDPAASDSADDLVGEVGEVAS